MKTDIVFPDGNEKEFIELAEKLGFDSLIFAYDRKKKFYELEEKQKIKTYNALITEPKKIRAAKKKIDLVIVKSRGDDREIFERSKPDMIFAIEEKQKRDYMHQKGSGLNDVLSKLAVKNKIILGYSFNSILLSKKKKEKIMGKMMQNIELCRKYKIKMCAASFAKKPYQMRAYHDLVAFFVNLGMHPREAKNAFKTALKRTAKNQGKREGKMPGVRAETKLLSSI